MTQVKDPRSKNVKDPQAVLDYPLNIAEWLGNGETITLATVIADAGIAVDQSAIAGSEIVAWLSGGTANQQYRVTFQWTTNQGRTDQRTIVIYVREV